MPKKFNIKDVKIVDAVPSETEALSDSQTVATTISTDLVLGSTVLDGDKTGTVIWEGLSSGQKKIKIKWSDGSMSFRQFDS